MRILVSGGAGFIGSQVAARYQADGHAVAIVDDFSSGLRDNVPDGVTVYEANIRDDAAMRRIADEFAPETVNHHAAQLSVSRSVADPRHDAEVNILGFLTLVEAVRGTATRIVVASSGGAMYGDTDQVPTPETFPAAPVSPYGIAKRTMEYYLHFYEVQYGLSWAALRYANVYGPKQNPAGETGVIAVFLDALGRGVQPLVLGDGMQTRDYVFVDDVVAANVAALGRGSGPYNIGTGQETTVIDLFHAVQKAMDTSFPVTFGPVRPGEQRRSALDASRARAELGWEPRTPLADGIAATVAWYRGR